MAKKIRFSLEMADGVHVRTLAELKEHFVAERVVGYYLDGKLKTWLDDRYIEKEAAAVDALSRDDEALAQKLCEIFGVEYLGDLDPEEIAYRNERIARLKQLTDDLEIIKQVDIVAFDQDDLFDRYDEGRKKIILADGEFDIPESKKDIEYVRLDGLGLTAIHDIAEPPASQDTADSGFEYILKINKSIGEFHDVSDMYGSYGYFVADFYKDLLLFLWKQKILDSTEVHILNTYFQVNLGSDIEGIEIGRFISSEYAERIKLLINQFFAGQFPVNGFFTKPRCVVDGLVKILERRIEAPSGSYSLAAQTKLLNIEEARKAMQDIPNLSIGIEDLDYRAVKSDTIVLRKNDISKEKIQELFDEEFKPLGCELTSDSYLFIITGRPTDICSLYIKTYNMHRNGFLKIILDSLVEAIRDIPHLKSDIYSRYCLDEHDHPNLGDYVILRDKDISEEEIRKLFNQRFKPLGCTLTNNGCDFYINYN